jgi:hypothetical protein
MLRLVALIAFIFPFIAAICLMLFRAQRRHRPNYWRKDLATSSPDPRCERFPDWKVHSQKER